MCKAIFRRPMLFGVLTKIETFLKQDIEVSLSLRSVPRRRAGRDTSKSTLMLALGSVGS
jgi:hypothetical protein